MSKKRPKLGHIWIVRAIVVAVVGRPTDLIE